MTDGPSIAVLYGGIGPERDISLATGASVADALETGSYRVIRHELKSADLPEWLDPAQTVVMPALHGEFGEDGQIQALMEARGFTFCGSDSAASRRCMHKAESKRIAKDAGLAVLEGMDFEAGSAPGAKGVVAACGTAIVLKPEDQGSSVGLQLLEGEEAVAGAFENLKPGRWMVERRVFGREFSIGILHGRGLGVVELLPSRGVYDYAAKYTPGQTRYDVPARLPDSLETRIRAWAERLFNAAGCRDFARVDFMLEGEDGLFFLEINSLPGLTPTSLLPKSASCVGFSFENLAKELVRPAIDRFNASSRSTDAAQT